MMRVFYGMLLTLLLMVVLTGCGRRIVRVDLVPVEDRLSPQVVEQDPGAFVKDQIVMVDITGLIVNSQSRNLLSSGKNPVSDLREILKAVEENKHAKALILRINSPGGTVTASDMMYRELRAFKEKTQMPVVTCMLDVCASGGYYISCASDYRIAYPTTITGSIGVIVQTFSVSGTLDKIGVTTRAITSGPNKDMLSPFKPLDQADATLVQKLVDEFYMGFRQVVRESPNHIPEGDWTMVTDGRVFTGKQAVVYGLIDEVGDLQTAISKAKQMAGIQKAKSVSYTRGGEVKGSVYASAGRAGEAMSPEVLSQWAADTLATMAHPQFLYLWMGQ